MDIINKAPEDMSGVINHDYMNNFTRKIQEKSDKIRSENQAKIKKLKDYGGYRTNNASLKRNSEIKKHYLNSSEILRDPSKKLSSQRRYFSPQNDANKYSKMHESGPQKCFMLEASRPAYN